MSAMKRAQRLAMTPAYPQPLGFVQLSDHARQQLDEGLPKRSCANTLPREASPFTESCALRAGMKVLKTPSGRFIAPGGMVRMKGVIRSHHARTMASSSLVTRSSTL